VHVEHGVKNIYACRVLDRKPEVKRQSVRQELVEDMQVDLKLYLLGRYGLD
jgi:hypothetical protein